MTYALTGTTGNLGGRVAAAFDAAGIDFLRPRARYADAAGFTAQVSGADTVLLVSGRESANRVAEHLSAVDAAVEAGVKRIVYISFAEASPTSTFTFARDHWHTEQYIRATGVPFVFLRDNLYQQLLPSLVGQDGVIRGPGADGRVAAVAYEDIARGAVEVLTNDKHDGSTYTLTGPEALSLDEVAAVIADCEGRPVRYETETLDEAYASRAGFGAPQFEVDGWVSSYTAIAAGELATVTGDVELLTGRAPADLSTTLRSLPR